MVTYFMAKKAERVFAEYKNAVMAYWHAKPKLVPLDRKSVV